MTRAGKPRSPADIFADALEREPEERAGFLREACAGDPELLAEVESLLLAYRRMEGEGTSIFAFRDRERAGHDGEVPE